MVTWSISVSTYELGGGVGKRHNLGQNRDQIDPFQRSSYNLKYIWFNFEISESLKLVMLKENFSGQQRNSPKQTNK